MVDRAAFSKMHNAFYSIEPVGSETCLWRYTVTDTGRSFDIGPPVFEIDGRCVRCELPAISAVCASASRANGTTEHVYAGAVAGEADLKLEMTFRLAADNPVVRFKYRLVSDRPRELTKRDGTDNLSYLRLNLADLPVRKEIRLSEFDWSNHTYRPVETPIGDTAFADGMSVMGPMLLAADDMHSLLVAYEHGSQAPDAFLRYDLMADCSAVLRAEKGNYCAGRVPPYETLWFDAAVVKGNETTLAGHFRAFVLRHMTANNESRKPYIFYNTWNYQERNKWWNGKKYLSSMNEKRMLAEIDVAHKMGVDVFVLDTGWYEKTGDWQVGCERFPRGLEPIKKKLDSYGMKLGLWFNPTAAAVSSQILKDSRDCVRTWGGEGKPFPVWETEESHSMCLVSEYADRFADELIRLVKEVGVTYFKWDAIGQRGCDHPGHMHGTEANSPEERVECYAFELVRYMARVVDRLCAECPEAIVDFDVTEPGRAVGLAFLAAGKFFLINNGPYYASFDYPEKARIGTGMGTNVYVYPGPTRARLCRQPLGYDRWIPSVLFLTHYLPDDPSSSQMINICSLILGQNGIWGDLLSVSDEGIGLFGRLLRLYKQVRDDITASFPVRTGIIGGSLEVHEKINNETGRGAAIFFVTEDREFEYVTANRVAAGCWASDGLEAVKRTDDGRARIAGRLERFGAGVVFFGVDGKA